MRITSAIVAAAALVAGSLLATQGQGNRPLSPDGVASVHVQGKWEKTERQQFTLGGDATIAAGPVGRNAQAKTDAAMTAEILSYSRSRGVFAGVALEGGTLREDDSANKDLYGKGATFAQAGVEINTLRVDAVGPIAKPTLTQEQGDGADPAAARKASRQAYFDGRWLDTAVYDYTRLGPGARVAGPAIVEAPLTTIVIPPGYQGAVDSYRNVIIT